MKSEARLVLETAYRSALEDYRNLDDHLSASHFDDNEQSDLQTVLDHLESNKGVFTVLITLFVKKIIDPDQDIRAHQRKLDGGFSGRGFDTKEITPFLQEQNLLYMQSGSGWLTRSLEQSEPYDQNYPGAIRPPRLREAFLRLIQNAEDGGDDWAESYLQIILMGLIWYREENVGISLFRPVKLPISEVVQNVISHSDTNVQGASRLPVLAIFAILDVLVKETNRYRRCRIAPLESHTTADSKTHHIGDINIFDEYDSIFEAYEIKHKIQITVPIIRVSAEKLTSTTAERYYILTTYPHKDYSEFAEEIRRVSRTHGCQVIVNGVYETLRYYLRLLGDSKAFINAYVNLLEGDEEVGLALKKSWNRIFMSGETNV